jgi:beta-phosphoglucomutase-like phosphatase (HAD superfamily)
MAIDFIVLGLDNVLFETEAAHLLSCNHTFEKCGLSHHWSAEQYRSAALAHGAAGATDAVAKKLGASIGRAAAAALTAEKNREFHDLACQGGIPLHAGCASLINEALEDGCKLAIVTDLPANTATVLLEQAFNQRLTDMFAVIATAVNFDFPRDNSAYHLVLRTVGADSSRSIAIESSVPGLLAAQRAGLWTLSTAPVIDDLDSVAGADSWYPRLRVQESSGGKAGSADGAQRRFISFDELDTLKSTSTIHPSFARSTAAACSAHLGDT